MFSIILKSGRRVEVRVSTGVGQSSRSGNIPDDVVENEFLDILKSFKSDEFKQISPYAGCP